MARILSESHRTLRSGGRLVISIPDFDAAIDCWQRRDPSFFRDEYWGYTKVTATWANHHVPDTLNYRAAFLFCGFWNPEYGHPFARRFHKNHGAYHGPPAMRNDQLQTLPHGRTPHDVAAALRQIVRSEEQRFTFNHQNAWGRSELDQLLARAGFRVLSFATPLIVERCASIPGIRSRLAQSTLCLAEKA